MDQKFNILIPAAGYGSRLRASYPKVGQMFVDGQRLFEKQIPILNNLCPLSDIFYVTGYLAEKVNTPLRDLGANVLTNRNFAHTNVSFSINMGIHEIGYDKDILLIMGDLLFDESFMAAFVSGVQNTTKSCLLIDKGDSIGRKEIGINRENGQFDYSFSTKWGQILYLKNHDVVSMLINSNKKSDHKKFCFEILNKMVDDGSTFNYIGVSGILHEIDKQRNVQYVNKHILNQVPE